MTLALTEPAAEEIRRRFASSTCQRPTASLMDASQTFPAPRDMVDAIDRKASELEMHELVMKELAARESAFDFRLHVGVYEADDCRPEDLVVLHGIQFAMPDQMRTYFRGYVLDYVDGQFILRNEHRVFVRLMDLDDGNGGAV
jgi:hypothetical protein